MRFLFSLVPLLFVINLHAQNVIDWDGVYALKLSDFQSTATRIGPSEIYSLQAATSVDFSFYMSNAEFMFTKNFNSKVNCTFNRSASAIVVNDSLTAQALVRFAQFQFDLAELYARKFRKKLHDEKGAFSSVSFFKPIYDAIQVEFVERYSRASTDSNVGQNNEKLTALHQEVLLEIEQLAEFCKACKISKRKNN